MGSDLRYLTVLIGTVPVNLWVFLAAADQFFVC